MKKCALGLVCGLVAVAVQSASAIQVAGSLLVDVSASDVASVGDGNPVAVWSNSGGSLGGSFDRWSGCPGPTYRASVRGAPALWFDGTSNSVLVASFVDTPPALIGGNNTWSAEFWILCPSINLLNGDFMAWTRRPGGSASNTLVEFRYGTDGQVIEHYSGNLQWGAKPPHALWHHVVTTRDSSQVERVYVNGVLVNTQTLNSLNVRTDGRMVFGATMDLENPTFSFPYYGYIGQARIHTGVLSDLDVASNYVEELPNYIYTPYPDGTAFVDIRAGDLSSLNDNDTVQSWPDNGIFATPFTTTVSSTGPKYYANVQGAPAVLFDPSTDNVLVGATVPPDLTANPTYTMEVWLNCPTFRTVETDFLSWTPRSTATGTIVEYRYFSNAILCDHYGMNETWAANTPPAANQWHHIAVTRDSATGNTFIYVDGLLNNKHVIPGLTIRSDGSFVLGGTANNDPRTGGFVNNFGYNGYMGALRISAGTKSSQDILARFNAEAPAYGLPPVSVGGDAAWAAPGGGDWSVGANWSPQTPPDGATQTASFIYEGVAVTNDLSGLTLLEILLGEPSVTLSGNPITFSGGGAIRGLYAGDHTVSAPLVLNGAFTATIPPGGNTLALSGDISGAGPLVNIGGITTLSGANTFTGGLTNQLGTLAIDDPAALGMGPLTIGNGTLRYTGPGATYTLPVRTESAIASAATIEVTDPAATLTLSGKFDGNMPFVKRGPGTLAFTYPGEQQLNTAGSSSAALYTYTPDGTIAPGTFGAFAVDEGTVVLGAPGQTNIIRNAQVVYVGTRNSTSAKLYVNAGTLSLLDNNWFFINRGTLGDASMYVSGADTRVQTSLGLVMCNPEGVANYSGTALLDIDEATFIVSGGNGAYVNEAIGGTSTVNVRNGATFEVNARNNAGLAIPQTHNSPGTLTADNASVVRAYHLSVNSGGTLEVKGGSRLENDQPGPGAFVHNNATWNKGTVSFDNATLAQRTAGGIGFWLHDVPRLFVGNGGMTLEASGWALLDPVLTNAPGATPLALTKTGPGTAVIRTPATIPANVTDGTLGMFSTTVMAPSNPPPASILTMAGGNIAPATDGALFNQTVIPNNTGTLELSPVGTLRFWDAWQANGGGFMRNDGWFQFANGATGRATSIFLKERQRVTAPWTVSFAFIGEGIVADGFAFVIHNDARGAGAIGASGNAVGFANTITDSLGIIFDAYSNDPMGKIKYGRWNGSAVTVSEIKDISSFPLRDPLVKTYITLSYDGTDTISCVMRRADGRTESCEVNGVDILSLVGNDMAYVGLTGATGGSVIQQGYLGDIIWDDGVTSTFRQNIAQHGGNVLLGGGTLNAFINNTTPLQSVSALDTLTFADGATLNTEAALYPYSYTYETALPNLLLNQSAWQLNDSAAWMPDGSVRVSETDAPPKLGTFFSTSQYDVSGAWIARITYQMGASTTQPADFFSFSLQNQSPTATIPNTSPYLISQGLSVRWDYWTTKPATQLAVYLNGNGNALSPVLTSLGNVTLSNKELTYMTLTYDPAAQTLTVLTEQPSIGASHTHTFTGLSLLSIMSASGGKAHIGCTARSGGSAADDFVLSLGFESGTRVTTGTANDTALAFRRYDGAGTINHEGTAALALLGDVDYAPADLTLRLNGGGLNLRRATDEPLGTAATRGDWIGTLFTNNVWAPVWTSYGDAHITTNLGNTAAGIASAHRANVARDFTANFTYISANASADGFALVFHNDDRGNTALSGTGGVLGYAEGNGGTSIKKSFALRFNIYNNNQIGIGKNGAWVGSLENTVNLKNTSVDVATVYDSAAKTFTATLSSGGTSLTHTFTDVDIAALTESDYATVLLCGTTGGQVASQMIRNFVLNYPAPISVADERLAVGATDIPAGTDQTFTLDVPTVANPMFLIQDGTFGDGSALRLVSKTGGALRYANTALDGAVTVDIQSGVTLNLQNVTGGAYELTKLGDGTLILSGDATLATLNLVEGHSDLSGLATGSGTQFNLSSGATLDAGTKLIIGGATMNGVKIPSGIYRPGNAPWVTAGQVNIGSIGTALILR